MRTRWATSPWYSPHKLHRTADGTHASELANCGNTQWRSEHARSTFLGTIRRPVAIKWNEHTTATVGYIRPCAEDLSNARGSHKLEKLSGAPCDCKRLGNPWLVRKSVPKKTLRSRTWRFASRRSSCKLHMKTEPPTGKPHEHPTKPTRRTACDPKAQRRTRKAAPKQPGLFFCFLDGVPKPREGSSRPTPHIGNRNVI